MRLEANPSLPLAARRELLAAAHRELSRLVAPFSQENKVSIVCFLDCRQILVDLHPSVTFEWPEGLERPAELTTLLAALLAAFRQRGLNIET